MSSFPFVQQTSRTAVQLNHVFGFGQTLSIAVGANGTILNWNGQQWSTVVSGTNQQLNKAWGASSSSIWVVGAGGTLLNSLDGGITWTQSLTFGAAYLATNPLLARSARANLTGIWGSSVTDFWVVDSALGEFFHTVDGGNTWTLSFTMRAQWSHLWGSGASNVVAVGYTGSPTAVSTVLAQSGGTGWTGAVQPTGPNLGLGCWPSPTATQIWSCGASGVAMGAGGSIRDQRSFGPSGAGVYDVQFPDVSTYYGMHGFDGSSLYAAGVSATGACELSQAGNPPGSPSAATTWLEVPMPLNLPVRGGLSGVYADKSGYTVAVGAYGVIVAAAGTALSMVSAVPQSTKSVRVTLTTVPLAQSSIGQGDALNPQSWFIQRLDNGQRLTTIAVNQISPTVFDVVIAERFGSTLVQHEIEATTLTDPFGNAIQAPTLLDFAGVVADTNATQEALTAANGYVITDLLNTPFPPPGSNMGGGVRVINASGDFASNSGNDLITKLVLRRLTTPPGGFFHLPNYGAGIIVKQPIKGGDLVTLKKNVQQQVLMEPEISTANVQLSLDSSGVLSISIQGLTTTGQKYVVQTNMATPAVQL